MLAEGRLTREMDEARGSSGRLRGGPGLGADLAVRRSTRSKLGCLHLASPLSTPPRTPHTAASELTLAPHAAPSLCSPLPASCAPAVPRATSERFNRQHAAAPSTKSKQDRQENGKGALNPIFKCVLPSTRPSLRPP